MHLRWIVVLVAGLLFGCEIDPKSNYQTRYAVHSGVHVVEEGESLQMIAARYHQDFKNLARRNGIRYPYWIYPGQKLNLKSDRSTNYRFAEFRSEDHSANFPTRFPARPSRNPNHHYATANDAESASPGQAVSLDWQWPLQGEIIAPFDVASGSPGINIQSQEGAPVVAAADGVVKYLGDQVRDLGKVVIISHGNGYVTVYAHNRRFLTEERHHVKKGEVVRGSP